MESAFRQFVGAKSLAEAWSPENAGKRAEKELICCVTNLFDFDSLCLNASPEQMARTLDGYYAMIADAVLQTGCNVDHFEGPAIVSFYGTPQPIDDRESLIAKIVPILDKARASVETAFGVRVGLGLCGGKLVYGHFGGRDRATVTAFRPAAICARRLAESGDSINLCEHMVAGSSQPKILGNAFVSVRPHCQNV